MEVITQNFLFCDWFLLFNIVRSMPVHSCSSLVLLTVVFFFTDLTELKRKKVWLLKKNKNKKSPQNTSLRYREQIARGGSWANGWRSQKVHISSYKISHGGAMYSVATIDNTTVLHIWKLLREQILSQGKNYVWWWVLTTLWSFCSIYKYWIMCTWNCYHVMCQLYLNMKM